MDRLIDAGSVPLIGPLHIKLADFLGHAVNAVGVVKDVEPALAIGEVSQDCTMS